MRKEANTIPEDALNRNPLLRSSHHLHVDMGIVIQPEVGAAGNVVKTSHHLHLGMSGVVQPEVNVAEKAGIPSTVRSSRDIRRSQWTYSERSGGNEMSSTVGAYIKFGTRDVLKEGCDADM